VDHYFTLSYTFVKRPFFRKLLFFNALRPFGLQKVHFLHLHFLQGSHDLPPASQSISGRSSNTTGASHFRHCLDDPVAISLRYETGNGIVFGCSHPSPYAEACRGSWPVDGSVDHPANDPEADKKKLIAMV
jgi:hypothetical protein